jgi:PAS domain S-box-containing protein
MSVRPAFQLLFTGDAADLGRVRGAVGRTPSEFDIDVVDETDGCDGIPERVAAVQPDAVVVGSTASNPLSTARQYRQLSPRSQIVFLLPPERLDRFRAGLPFVPHLGSAWTVSTEVSSENLQRILRDAARTARARAAAAAVLGRINLQLASAPRSPEADIRRSQLAMSERYLATLLSQSPDAFLAVDGEGTLIAWNEAARRLFSIGSDDVLGMSAVELFPQDQRSDVKRLIEEARQEQTALQQEVPLSLANGEIVAHGEISLAPVHDEAGKVVSVSITARDVTARKRAEEELRQLNDTLEQRITQAIAEREQAEEALRQAQKMEAVGQLTGGIAHDFNNLLQIITGNLEILQRNLSEDAPRLRRAADNAMTGAKRAATLTQRLLAFSRRQPLDPKPIDVNKLVRSMSELLHRALGETVELETVLGARLWPVEADPNQLESAILNLAVNARDAMPQGGKLTIETSNTHLDEAYAASHAEVMPGQYVVICVSDTGVGMDEDTMARVFEPFFTTKEAGKGTGLGLSQVYGFVKQSGGHVKIYSEPGQGTTVKIYLPRLVGVLAADEIASERPAPEGMRSETILVVEDDDNVRAYSVEVLRELGYRVLEARDGAAALTILERQHERIDLLFSDVVLPGGMTGAMLAREARALRPGLKVLFTTGYARNAIVHHGRLDPGVQLITKPFTYANLAAKVRDVLDGK